MSATSATDANALAVCPDMSPSTPSTTRKYPREIGSQCVAIVSVQGHLPAISSQTLAIRPPTQYSLTILGLISYLQRTIRANVPCGERCSEDPPPPLTCPLIDTFPFFDSVVLEIGPGGAFYGGPIGEAAKLWCER